MFRTGQTVVVDVGEENKRKFFEEGEDLKFSSCFIAIYDVRVYMFVRSVGRSFNFIVRTECEYLIYQAAHVS